MTVHFLNHPNFESGEKKKLLYPLDSGASIQFCHNFACARPEVDDAEGA